MIKVSLVKYRLTVLFALISVLFQIPAFAKDITIEAPTVKDILKVDNDKEVTQETPKEQASYDRLNRGTPRGSVMSLSESIKQGGPNLVMDFLDMRQVPKHIADQGPELVRKLGIVAERIFWMGPENLSIEPTGHLDDGLPSYRDRVATINTPDGPVDILMQRVPGDKKGDHIWKVSNRTVMEIPRLYDLYGYGELGDKLSTLIPEFKGLAFQPWQMVVLIGIVVVAYLIAWFLTWLGSLFLKRSKSSRSEQRPLRIMETELSEVVIFSP